MPKKKIALVVVRYGNGINGGAEFHCRMLAERLVTKYDTEVITTCVKNHVKRSNDFPEGTEMLDGVLVRRFPIDGQDSRAEAELIRKSRRPIKVRRILQRMGILRFIRHWNWGLDADTQAWKYNAFHSSGLNEWIRSHKNDYEAIIALTSDFAPFYYTAMFAGDKMIAIPTLHDITASFRPSLPVAFSRIRHVAFNAPAEARLGRSIFGWNIRSSSIVGVGIEVPEPEPWESVKEELALPEKYMLYIGRIESGKVGKLISYYEAYKEAAGEKALPLVMVGGVHEERYRDLDGIIMTGFISDARKRSVAIHSQLLVNPSKYESLSLVLLEALNDGIPVFVNGKCNVLREHCRRSKGAVKCWTGKKSFVRRLRRITEDEAVRAGMIAKGKEYFEKNYAWDKVLPRLYDAIDKVSGRK